MSDIHMTGWHVYLGCWEPPVPQISFSGHSMQIHPQTRPLAFPSLFTSFRELPKSQELRSVDWGRGGRQREEVPWEFEPWVHAIHLCLSGMCGSSLAFNIVYFLMECTICSQFSATRKFPCHNSQFRLPGHAMLRYSVSTRTKSNTETALQIENSYREGTRDVFPVISQLGLARGSIRHLPQWYRYLQCSGLAWWQT